MFWHDLANAWGVPVKELQGRMDSEELCYQIAYQRIRGLTGDARRDIQAGIVASQIHNYLQIKAGLKDYKWPGEFLLYPEKTPVATPEEEPPAQSAERQKILLEAMSVFGVKKNG